MADDNLPGEGTVATTPAAEFDDAVSGLSKLLSDPETDLADGGEEQEQAAETVDAEAPEADAENVETEDVENPEQPEDGDGPQEDYAGGRFAADDAKVRMADGRVISVADLKSHADSRIKEFQRGFTEKTTALKAKETEVDQLAQSLSQFRDYAAWYAEQFLPKPPEPFTGDPRSDPLAYLEWQQKRDEYQAHLQAWQTFTQQREAEEKRKAETAAEESRNRVLAEREALFAKIPTLKDPSKGDALWKSFKQGAQEHYGIPPDLVDSVGDHRLILVLRDALEYRRLKAKAPQVREEVSRRPPPSGKRFDANANARRDQQARTERLQQTGSFDDGVAALKNLIS